MKTKFIIWWDQINYENQLHYLYLQLICIKNVKQCIVIMPIKPTGLHFLKTIFRWWKDLNVAEKLPFARDRMVECYFWILGVYFEPRHFLARRILTKVISLTSVIDDIYDVYGTTEELILFTDAIQRFNTVLIYRCIYIQYHRTYIYIIKLGFF